MNCNFNESNLCFIETLLIQIAVLFGGLGILALFIYCFLRFRDYRQRRNHQEHLIFQEDISELSLQDEGSLLLGAKKLYGTVG